MAFYIKSKFSSKFLEVAEYDFPNEMTWDEAIEACKILGNGWRLPSKEELHMIYDQLYLTGLSVFEDKWYWSDFEIQNYSAYLVGIVANNSKIGDKKNHYQVRAVRVSFSR